MYSDIVWRQRGNRGNCVAKTFNVAAYANKFTRSDVGHFWDLIVRKSGIGTHVNKPSCWKHDDQFRWKRASYVSSHQRLWEEERWKVKEVERKPFTTMEVKEPLNWFFALLFRSISSVSTEQSQICATDWRKSLLVQENLPEFANSRNQTEGEMCESLVIPTEIANAKNTVSQSWRLVARIRTEIRRTSWWSEIVETMLRRWFLKGNWQTTILNHT